MRLIISAILLSIGVSMVLGGTAYAIYLGFISDDKVYQVFSYIFASMFLIFIGGAMLPDTEQS